ncbi:MAG: glycosyltransferase family 9 protein [Methylococcaceae bacterium]|nr:glycosyltransferase family 9 protein [Methylococcaceae bacterium]
MNERLLNKPGEKSILIFRIGSLGDTIVALPALHLIARAFPEAERVLLTNFPLGIGRKEAPMSSVLGDSNLVHDYMSYPIGLSNWKVTADLLRQIRVRGFETLVYLMSDRSRFQLFRDDIFFHCAGVRNIVGLNHSREYHRRDLDPRTGLYESEASRLVRNLASLGKVDLSNPAWWNLELSARERSGAMSALQEWQGAQCFVAASVGTKVDVKDWGHERWMAWAKRFSGDHPELGLSLVGAPDEAERSAKLAACWSGPAINLCGRLTPRQSAVVLEQALFYVGHDSGPMHLASAVGTPCIAIFSGHNKPGEWFPCGEGHSILFHQTECFGCFLDYCERYDKKCIKAITVDDVLRATQEMLSRVTGVMTYQVMPKCWDR